MNSVNMTIEFKLGRWTLKTYLTKEDLSHELVVQVCQAENAPDMFLFTSITTKDFTDTCIIKTFVDELEHEQQVHEAATPILADVRDSDHFYVFSQMVERWKALNMIATFVTYQEGR